MARQGRVAGPGDRGALVGQSDVVRQGRVAGLGDRGKRGFTGDNR